MNTFTFVVNRNLQQKQLEAQANNTRRWILRSGEGLEQHVRLLPDVNCGWFWLRTDEAHHAQTISDAVGELYAVIAYGGVLGSSESSTAQVIFNAWAKGGAPEVLRLDGNFGAVVVDRIEQSVHLLSDIIGHRALRYFTNELMFVASPHDVSLVTTGLVPVEFNLETAASITAVNWAVGGKSLLRNVHTVDGGEHVRWNNGRLQHYPTRLIDPSTRIQPHDDRAIRHNVDELISTAQSNVRALGKESSIIYTSLTAGVDSRAVLGLLLSELNPNQIIAVTRGKANSLDVSVAARIAKMYRVQHRIEDVATSYISVQEFTSNVDALAFAMNGDTSAKRAATPFRQVDRNAIQCEGMGGEIIRGFYYPHANSGSRMPLTEEYIVHRVDRRPSNLPWLIPEYSDWVLAQIVDRIRQLSAQSASGYDVLDLYYLRERYRVWAALGSRTYIARRRFSPLISPSTVRLAYRMPSPIGDHALFTYDCIRRFTPRAYWIRINGTEWPALNHGVGSNLLLSNINWSARRILKRLNKTVDRLEQSLNGAKPCKDAATGTPDEARAGAFAGPLFEYIRELLTEDRSLALGLFGRKGVEKLLEQHASGARNNLEVLGRQVTIEHYRKMIEGAALESR